MIIVSGNTFPHRDLLKGMGASWDNSHKVWMFSALLPASQDVLRRLPGVIVTKTKRERQPWEDFAPSPPVRQPRQTNVLLGDDMTYHGYFAGDDPLVFAGFSSLGAFVDHVAELKRPENLNGRCDIGWTAKPGYAGTDNMRQALDIARNGWTDGLGMGDRLLPPDPTAKRRQRAVAGGKVNVGRMLAGVPDHMVKRTRQPGKKIITIFVEAVMWEGIQINTAIIRVIAIAAIIDRLEQKGYQCNLVSVYCAHKGYLGREVQLAVRIKDAGERLNIADMSFAFGHPSYGRRLVYAHHGCIPETDMTATHRGTIGEAFNKSHQPGSNEFYIPQVRGNINDVWKMLEAITPDNLPIEIKRD